MGIIFKQSLHNTLIIYLAFALGGINVLFLYTFILSEQYFGLVTFLLSSANIVMPLMAFGVNLSIVKFYSSYKNENEKDNLLFMGLVVPLLFAIPVGIIGVFFYDRISLLLSQENPIVKDYTYIIFLVALFTAYFEVFYAWSRVHLQSVFGNLMKELFTRIAVFGLLILVYFGVISEGTFIYYLTASYVLRTMIMMAYAFYIRRPKWTFSFPKNYKAVFHYSFYIILAGTAGTMVLDIDKFMIPQKLDIAQTAFYAVAVYIGSVIEAPGRAMAQILQPLTAQAINEKNNDEVKSLYKKSHINLLWVSGLVFLLVNLNILELYRLIPEKYAGGIWVVLMISIAKLSHMFLGNNGSIIGYTKHYKILLPYSLSMSFAVVCLNYWFIDLFGINGAALSTLIVVLFFNYLKIWFVKKKFDLLPFTDKTLLLIGILIIFYFAFVFWDFPFHPVVNILLKTFIISALYVLISIQWRITEEAMQLWFKLKNLLFNQGKF